MHPAMTFASLVVPVHITDLSCWFASVLENWCWHKPSPYRVEISGFRKNGLITNRNVHGKRCLSGSVSLLPQAGKL
jgi:hypothetical protein